MLCAVVERESHVMDGTFGRGGDTSALDLPGLVSSGRDMIDCYAALHAVASSQIG